MLHWASLLIFFGLALLALWVTYTFFGKVGMYFFAIVANVVCSYFAEVELCGIVLRLSMSIMPVIFLAIYVAYAKYGKKEATRLFYVALFSKVTMFILRFFEFAFLDIANQSVLNLNWMSLRYHIASVLAFGLAGLIMYVIVEYVNLSKIENFFKVNIYIAVPSLINCLVQFLIAYPGYHAFSKILVAFLYSVALTSVLSLVLSCVEMLFNFNLFQNKQNSLAAEVIGDGETSTINLTSQNSYSQTNKINNYSNSNNSNNTPKNNIKDEPKKEKKGLFGFKAKNKDENKKLKDSKKEDKINKSKDKKTGRK